MQSICSGSCYQTAAWTAAERQQLSMWFASYIFRNWKYTYSLSLWSKHTMAWTTVQSISRLLILKRKHILCDQWALWYRTGRDIQDHNLQKAGYGQRRRLRGRKVCNRAAWRPSSLVTWHMPTVGDETKGWQGLTNVQCEWGQSE